MYLLNARTLLSMAESVEGDEKTKARVRFAVQQWIDAASPSNYLALNPEAQTQGDRDQGREHRAGPARTCWHDMQQGPSSRRPTRACSRSAATSPRPKARWCSRTSCSSCIEYKPLTAKVHERPMLFVPPCINKYYILDLQPENSLIRYTVEQGHRVFVDELAQRRRRDRCRAHLGRLHRARRRSRRSSVVQRDHAASSRSTRWASASAARSSPPRWRCWRRAASSRRRA